jgi:hypothetical protein
MEIFRERNGIQQKAINRYRGYEDGHTKGNVVQKREKNIV